MLHIIFLEYFTEWVGYVAEWVGYVAEWVGYVCSLLHVKSSRDLYVGMLFFFFFLQGLVNMVKSIEWPSLPLFWPMGTFRITFKSERTENT